MHHHQPERRRAAANGFTLIETLVVIAILGILAGVVVYSVSGVSDKGEDSACAIEERSIRVAVEAYRAHHANRQLPDDSDWGDLVPDHLSDEPVLFAYVNNGDDTYSLDPVAGEQCAP